MSHVHVTSFIITIFNVLKENKSLGNGVIEVSLGTEKHAFNLSGTLPQSYCFYSSDVAKFNNKIKLSICDQYCVEIDIPLRLYFSDQITNEFVMHNSKNDINPALMPPIVTLSITPSIPLPIIIGPYTVSRLYTNNNLPSPMYSLDSTFAHKTATSIHRFIAECYRSNIWNGRNMRHMALITLFDKMTQQNQNGNYITTLPTYKLLHSLCVSSLDYAYEDKRDVTTFYLVLCISRITFYRQETHLNCMIDDLQYEAWISNVDIMYQLMDHLLQKQEDKQHYLSCLRIILSWILLHQTENRHIKHKFDTMYAKLDLIHDIITKLPLYLKQQSMDNNNDDTTYLFEWFLQPICQLLIQNNKHKNDKNRSLRISVILSWYQGKHKRKHTLLSREDYDLNDLDIEMEEGENELHNQGLSFKDGIGICIAGVPIVPGMVRLTNYRLIFLPFESRYQHYKQYFEVPLGSIDDISSRHLTPNDTPNVLQQQILSYMDGDIGNIYKLELRIITKDCRDIKLLFANISQITLNKFMAQLRYHAFTNDIQKTFAFQRGYGNDNGWKVFDFFEEFTRQKVSWQKWKISHVNVGYKYSPTYPLLVIVPSTITDSDLNSIQSFRSKSRIPVLTYYHSPNGAVIMRSSQPMIGMAGLGGFVSTSWWSQNRCICDEKLLLDACIKYIIDARPKMNAVVNQATAGGGYENTVDFYKGIRLIFGNIHNIHEVRKSFRSMLQAIHASISKHNDSLRLLFVNPNTPLTVRTPHHEQKESTEEKEEDLDVYELILRDDYFWNSIISSLWFSYLRNIIACSVCIVSMIDGENNSVLVHCSDGWDRTTQLCSLVQILLDPYFRTIRGLACLIEKEWLSFGHKYHQRLGQTKKKADDQRSPIFIQFLDCLHQIVCQHQTHFEYNIDLLSYIAYHTTSCLYGTFLTNCERERLEKYKLHKKTPSIWTNLLNEEFVRQHKLKNVQFTKSCSANVLYIDHRSMNLSIWSYYIKIDPFAFAAFQNTVSNTTLSQTEQFTKTQIISKQKDLEIVQLKKEIESLKSKNKELENIELQFQNIMKCIDTNNGFLLQGMPIIPDLDYVSAKNTNTSPHFND